jgi:flagellin
MRLQRSLLESSQAMERSLERLSSGQRINRPSDDATGQSVASALDLRSRVYGQAIRNANDTVSALNIADGAFGELSNVLIRLGELASSAANGSLSLTQRQTLDAEATQLTTEFNRLVASTRFNGRSLVDGSLGELATQLGFGNNERLGISIGDTLARNVGTGAFDSVSTGSLSGDVSGSSVSGDFNGDGNLDFVMPLLIPGQLEVMYGDGAGGFSSATVSFSGGLALSSELAVADVNNDGRDDLLGLRGDSLNVLLSNGSSFAAASVVTTGISDFAVTDVNGDGGMDIVAARGSDLVTFLGASTGSFSETASIATGLSATALVVGDFNGDGIADTAVTNGTNLRVLNGSTSGAYAAGALSSFGSMNTQNLKAADLNHDGIADLVSGNITHLKVAFGQSDGTFGSVSSYATPTGAADYSIVDVNGDGNLDLARVNSSNGVSYALNNGAGEFNDIRSITASISTLSILGAGDVDNDGVVDFVPISEDGAFTGYQVLSQETERSTSIARVNLTSAAEARSSFDQISLISERLAQERGKLGAALSRLGSAIGMLGTRQEGYISASSRIKDVDVAVEASEALRLSIRQSISQSVLAQANLSPRIALSLLLDTRGE